MGDERISCIPDIVQPVMKEEVLSPHHEGLGSYLTLVDALYLSKMCCSSWLFREKFLS